LFFGFFWGVGGWWGGGGWGGGCREMWLQVHGDGSALPTAPLSASLPLNQPCVWGPEGCFVPVSTRRSCSQAWSCAGSGKASPTHLNMSVVLTTSTYVRPRCMGREGMVGCGAETTEARLRGERPVAAMCVCVAGGGPRGDNQVQPRARLLDEGDSQWARWGTMGKMGRCWAAWCLHAGALCRQCVVGCADGGAVFGLRGCTPHVQLLQRPQQPCKSRSEALQLTLR
jgi:hypothetical protein